MLNIRSVACHLDFFFNNWTLFNIDDLMDVISKDFIKYVT